MNETLYIFLEGKAKGWFEDTVNVVRKNGKIFDFVLDGEKIQPHDVVSIEILDDVIKEISS
ncbi:competence regulator inhibitor paratox [Streptococcus equi]|uniref:Phage protein n=2 Tax=Streptococcus dysgalactiae group TaxID=119603 RepID=A0AAW3GMH5_STRSZ|nr:phage protein [Streptococcus equi subsp. zooepidemicus Sz4is]